MRNTVRRRALIAGLACLAATAASAAGRPSAYRMSCAAAQRLVEASGAVVANTSPTTYHRLVADGRFCERTQVTRPAWIATADDPQCAVGFTCEERMRGQDF